jgi:hypothetical protein
VHLFTAWRPTLGAALTGVFTRQQLKQVHKELGFHVDVPPTSLAFEQWLKLFAYFKVFRNERTMRLISGSEHRLTQQQRRLQKIRTTRSDRMREPRGPNVPVGLDLV